MIRDSIDSDEDAKIIDDGDLQDSTEFRGVSTEISGVGTEISGLDSEFEDSMISEESLQRIFSSFSPEKPKTIEEFEVAYNRIRDVIESEQRFFTAKKIESRLTKEENEILKKQNADLKKQVKELEQALETFSQASAGHPKSSSGGTMKRRKKRKVSRRKN